MALAQIKEQKNIPALRFPEFCDEWSAIFIKNLSNINPKNTSLPSKFVYIDLESVKQGILLKEDILKAHNAPSRAQRTLKPKDILFQVVRPYQKNNYFFELQGNYVASTGYAQIRVNDDQHPEFIFHLLHTEKFIRHVLVRCTGTSYPAINSNDLSTIQIMACKKPEQQKIASFLNAVDQKIARLIKKKKLLEEYKKGIMQKLFSQKIRFKNDNGNPFPDWEEKRLSKFLIPQIREVRKPTVNYLAIGVRSHGKGTFQKPNSDPSDISMDKLYVVKAGDLVVNITFAWEGAIAIVKEEDDGGFVSHRFPTYTFKKGEVIGDFFRYVIIQKRFKYALNLISPGGAGRNRVLSKSELLKLEWALPSVPEQQKIADFLKVIDKKIEEASSKLLLAQTFKKGLLQQMFI